MYTGLPDHLRRTVADRDRWRCRWCGATNRGIDIHHIRYRRGIADDVTDNLICLCRGCHSFVHGQTTPGGVTISKHHAQAILRQLVNTPGLTGMALHRQIQHRPAYDDH